MDKTLMTFGSSAISALDLLLFASAAALILLALMAWATFRASTQRTLEAASSGERQRELDEKIGEMNQLNAQLTGRLQAMTESVSTHQAALKRSRDERLDAVSQRVGQGLEAQGKTTTEQLSKLGERLALIDAAQSQLAGLTQEVVSLKDILANKQTRGAFGQGRMEAIVRDGLPSSAYDFQFTLTNKSRPDCVIRLPGDGRLMVVDAKFPLESFTALKNADSDETRKLASARIRTEISKHIPDISSKYLIPGETQDIAVLFVPSESIYGDLNEHFDDLVQKAHRERVMIVSPSLLMMAIQVMQSLVRDAKMREQAHVIQKEVGLLLQDVGRLRDRVGKLENHFRQAQDDVIGIATSANKITSRGERMQQVEFAPETPIVAPDATPLFAPQV